VINDSANAGEGQIVPAAHWEDKKARIEKTPYCFVNSLVRRMECLYTLTGCRHNIASIKDLDV